ncbi:VanZ family protein [Candidatus Electronema sp. PJ]|uniref:VanZ family protein n=1 Tax=Candidatus Electronema sp. PJ TaxID=3401572 RepID=UPI003AA97AED
MIRPLVFIQTHWRAFTLSALIVITISSFWSVDVMPPMPGSDKTNHLIAYSALMFPTALRRPKQWLFYAGFFIAYSGGIELLQPYFQRYCEWQDLLANTTGILCGLLLATVLRYVFPPLTHSALIRK